MAMPLTSGLAMSPVLETPAGIGQLAALVVDRPPPTNPPAVAPPANHRLVAGPLYASLEEIDADVKQWARHSGFGVVHTSLKKAVDGRPIRVDYACAKGRIRPSKATVRKSSTRKTDCRWGARVACLKRHVGFWSFSLAKAALPHNHDVDEVDEEELEAVPPVITATAATAATAAYHKTLLPVAAALQLGGGGGLPGGAPSDHNASALALLPQPEPEGYPPTNIPTRPPLGHRLVAGPLYGSLEEIEADLKRWARGCGFAVIRQHSRKSVKGVMVRVDVACAKGRIRPSQRQSRQTTSYKNGCQWTAKLLSPKKQNGLWAFATPDGLVPHNHDAVEHPAGLAPLRGLPQNVRDLIKTLSEVVAIKPRQIAEVIRQLHPEVVFTTKDIDNYRQKLRRESGVPARPGGAAVAAVAAVAAGSVIGPAVATAVSANLMGSPGTAGPAGPAGPAMM